MPAYFSPGAEATDAIEAALQRQAQARQLALTNTLAQQREARLQESERLDLDMRKQELAQKQADRQAADDEKKKAEFLKRVQSTHVLGDYLDPDTIAQAKALNVEGDLFDPASMKPKPAPSPTPTGQTLGQGGAPIMTGLPQNVAPPSAPAYRFIGTPGERTKVQQKADFETAMGMLSPEQQKIARVAAAYRNATGSEPTPAILGLANTDKPDQPVMRVNPRTGKMEQIGVAPAGSHFVTEPAPVNVNAGPQGTLYSDYGPKGEERLFRVQGTTATPVNLPEGGTKTNPIPAAVETQMIFARQVGSHVSNIRNLVGQADQAGVLGPALGRYGDFMAGKVGTTGDAKKDQLLGQLRNELSFLKSGMSKVHFGARGGQGILERFDATLNGNTMSKEQLTGALDGYESWLGTYGKDPRSFLGDGATPPPATGGNSNPNRKVDDATIDSIIKAAMGGKKGGD